MLIEHFRTRRDEILNAAAALVALDSPSGDKARCDVLAELLARRIASLGTVERIANPHGGDHLRLVVSAPHAPADARPALLLCHYDTVWPAGTAAARPLRVEGDAAFGPGLYDMKASIAMAELALGALAGLGLRLARPVTLLITSDEEIGSPNSRALIEAEARASAHALVLEPPVEPHGALKTARKGVAGYDLEILGRAAHAGVEPEKGASAITELAQQILVANALANPTEGTTVNVGVVSGGSGRNVVPAAARMAVDVRAWSAAEAARVDAAFRTVSAQTPGVRIAVSGGFNRPPMERTPATVALFEQARARSAELGLRISEGATGGGSDGNFTAAVGTPTLDGLGSPGQGAHAEHEQISLAGLVERTALLALLLARI
jgi:glutamate carboxypeptidase